MFQGCGRMALLTLEKRLQNTYKRIPSLLKYSVTSTTNIKETHGYNYDLLVIGGGSGGLACAKEAAAYDKKVAVLDYVVPSPQGSTWGLGGTCVNVGCIPKKLMHQASLLGKAIKESSSYGWSVNDSYPEHNWHSLVEAVKNHILSLNWGHRVQLNQKNITYYNSFGTFIDQHTIEATDRSGNKELITSENIVIATGGRPQYPEDVLGATEYGITSDDLFSLQKPPGKTLVVGASYVALECAGFLQGLGFPTSVMIRSNPLKGFDQDLANLVVSNMQSEGVNIMRHCVPMKIEQITRDKLNMENNDKTLSIKYQWIDTQTVEIDIWDTVLFATGRRPVISAMKLDKAGIEVDSVTGKILVNSHDASSIPHIYAIGDVAMGRQELTPVAILAGKLLSKRLFGGSTDLMKYSMVPTTVFTPLEFSSVGLSESQAIEDYGEEKVEIYHAYYKPLEYYLPKRDSSQCYIKVVTIQDDRNNKVVGIHMTAPNAGEILQGFAVALCNGTISIKDIQHTVGIHPTCAEEIIKLHITKRSGLDPTVTGC